MHESAKCYNGDMIVDVVGMGDHYLIKCTNSLYRIDIATNEVTRIL